MESIQNDRSVDMIVAIDPGTTQSAYVLMDEDYKIYRADILPNDELLDYLKGLTPHLHKIVIEMIASYGMAVGQEVFDTCVWIGRFSLYDDTNYIYRKEEKINLCGTMKAKDTNIRQAIIDRLGKENTKMLRKDLWAAVAVGLTYLDKRKET